MRSMTFDRKVRLEIGRKLATSFSSNPFFFNIGVTTSAVANLWHACPIWTSSQESVFLVKLQRTWPSSAALSTKFRRGVTYNRQHKSSSWSLVFVRSALIVVVSPSHHCNCGRGFQLTFESYTRSHNFSERDKKLIAVNSSPLRIYVTSATSNTTILYYYYYYYYTILLLLLLLCFRSDVTFVLTSVVLMKWVAAI